MRRLFLFIEETFYRGTRWAVFGPNDEEDIGNGRLVCLVGVAPIRPAEFVVLRIEHQAPIVARL